MQQRILTFLLLLIGSQIQAQGELWSLEKCINYAVENSLQVQQASLGENQAVLNKKQAVWAQAPTINASFRHGVNLGRSIDPTTYDIVFTPTQSSSFGLNTNAVLFQGLQIRNTIKQSKTDLDAAQKDVQQAKNDVALAVAQAYLSILLAVENTEVLVEQAKVTKAQYEQTLKLIDAGVVAENSKYDLEAQMARDEENIVQAENTANLAYVNLKVAMNLDVAKEMTIEAVKSLEMEPLELSTLDAVYDEAIKNQPNIASAKLKERSAELGVKIAKGAIWPTISAYANAGTVFSSSVRNPATGEIVPYFVQLGAGFNGSVGVSVSIPILNGMRTRIGIQRAELAVKTAQMSTKQLENTLKSNIERALTDVKAAEKRLAAANKTVVATRRSVENTRKRYELGVVNSFELTSVQNTLVGSESNVLQAKYDYLFKLKILDYYRGRPIQIK